MEKMSNMRRCQWVNLDNPRYVSYHDNEWGVASFDDKYLFEMLVLESFQAGLSWECVLNKREYFREAFDNFDYEIIANYDEEKCLQLVNNDNIIRNKLKIKATVNNARIFMGIREEYGSFSAYIWSFTEGQIIRSHGLFTTSELSDRISLDLKKKGMTFVGSTIIYSYLQAIGIIDDHEVGCFKNITN